MKAVNVTPQALAVAGVAALGLLWYATRPGVASALGAGAVGAVADVGSGAVLGVGDVVGIPRTNTDQCSADLAAGNLWDASFSCPASRFVSDGLFGGGTKQATPDTWGSETRVPAWSGGASSSW